MTTPIENPFTDPRQVPVELLNGVNISQQPLPCGLGQCAALAAVECLETGTDSSQAVISCARGMGMAVLGNERDNLRQQVEDKSYLATHDPLTGLLNRPGLEGKFHEFVDVFNQGGYAGLVLLYGDLDKFKPVNDTHGHTTGDELLKQIANFLNTRTRRRQEGIRKPDVVVRVRKKDEPEDIATARMGGDEFAILALVTDEDLNEDLGKQDVQPLTLVDKGRRMAERLSSALFEHTFHIGGGLEVAVGITIGVEVWRPGMDLNELLHGADKKMYSGKPQVGKSEPGL